MDDHRFFGVDVKVQKAPDVRDQDKLTDAELEVCWERCQMAFWDILKTEAVNQLGVRDVFAEGRSGGWAVTMPTIHPKLESGRFKKFEELCETILDDILENAWPEAVKLAIAEKEERERIEARRSTFEVTLDWDLAVTTDKPILITPFLERVFREGLESNGLKNFEITVKEEA